MYEEVPSWLRPFLTPNAYDPKRQFLRDLDPQSRLEAILKFGFLELMSSEEGFLVRTNTAAIDNFIDSNGDTFMVVNGGWRKWDNIYHLILANK